MISAAGVERLNEKLMEFAKRDEEIAQLLTNLRGAVQSSDWEAAVEFCQELVPAFVACEIVSELERMSADDA